MTIKICASITAASYRELKRMTEASEASGADLLEIRLDYLKEDCSLKDVRKLSNLPIIATNRPSREGGFFEGAEEERIQKLISAVDSDFDYIDLELSAENSDEVIGKLMDTGVQIIISCHIPNSTPNVHSLNTILKEELSSHADICKIVTFAKEFTDNLSCLNFLEKASKKAEVVSFCMGDRGITSRLLSPLFGGCFTYASAVKGKEAAAGQLTVAEMRQFYNLLGV